MSSLACVPDRYMSESQLTAIHDEVVESVVSGQTTSLMVAAVINNVRLVYMSALLEIREEQHNQEKRHEQEIAALKQELAVAQESIAKYATGIIEAPKPTEKTLDPALGVTVQPTAETYEISWPAKRFNLYVGTTYKDYRRDLISWERMTRDEWIERLEFKAFKFHEPGLIRVIILETTKPPGRVMVTTEATIPEGWKHRMEFFAYDRPRPGTYLIWVAYRGDPDRCLLMKGQREDVLEGWERKLEFWVPK